MRNLKTSDPQIYRLIKSEEKRQKDVLEMIASENYASSSIIEALGSVLTNKYSEGFPCKRYYQGNAVVDEVESLAQERAQKLFKVPYVNVQPLSGAPANSAVYLAVLKNGEKMMGLSLTSGGHITHGHPLGLSGRLFTFAHYTSGVGFVLFHNGVCYGINSGYNPELKNIGKYLTLLKIQAAIDEGCSIYDAGGSGAFGWKEDFNLLKKPLYTLKK